MDYVDMDELNNSKSWKAAYQDPGFKDVVEDVLVHIEYDELITEDLLILLSQAWEAGSLRAYQNVAIHNMQASTGNFSILSDG